MLTNNQSISVITTRCPLIKHLCNSLIIAFLIAPTMIFGANNEAPTLSFTSDLSTLKKGRATTLRWSTTGATSCKAIGGWLSKTSTAGTLWVRISRPTTYQMTCTGANGTVTKSVTLNTADSDNLNTADSDNNETPDNNEAPTLSFTSDLSTLKKGRATTLRWSTTGATSCKAIGGWLSKTSTAGTLWVRISRPTTYQMTCTGANGTVTKSVTLNTADSDNLNTADSDNNETPDNNEAPTLSFTSDLSTLKKGRATTLRWSTTGATSCKAIGGWLSKTSTAGTLWVRISRPTTYQMTCTGANGTVTKSVTLNTADSDNLNTADSDNNETPDNNEAPTLSFTSDLSTLKKGRATTLRWSTTGATSCKAIGGWLSKTSTAGTLWVRISRPTTYQMTCTGANGTVTKSVTLNTADSDNLNTADSDNNETPDNNEAPTLSFTSDLSTLKKGRATTLRWSTTGATSCKAIGGWLSKTSTAGTLWVRISRPTTYQMTCTGANGTVTKSVTLNTADSDNLNTADSDNNETPVLTGSVELNWLAPTTNEDGTPISDLAGYKIYYGISQSNLNNVEKIDAGLTSYVVENLSSGTHYFSMTAIDTQGNESTRSNIAAKVVN